MSDGWTYQPIFSSALPCNVEVDSDCTDVVDGAPVTTAPSFFTPPGGGRLAPSHGTQRNYRLPPEKSSAELLGTAEPYFAFHHPDNMYGEVRDESSVFGYKTEQLHSECLLSKSSRVDSGYASTKVSSTNPDYDSINKMAVHPTALAESDGDEICEQFAQKVQVNDNWSSSSASPVSELSEEDDETQRAMTFEKQRQAVQYYTQDNEGDNTLMFAIIQLVQHVALRLICMAPNQTFLDLQNSLRQTALHLAVITKQPQIVRRLIVSGASLDLRDRNGNTPLHIACREGDMQNVKELTRPLSDNELEYQQHVCGRTSHLVGGYVFHSPEIKNYEGQTCLHIAAARGHYSIVEYLLDSHVAADVNGTDGKSGRTILHCAVERRDMNLILLLVNRVDLKMDHKTFAGHSALGIAAAMKLDEIVSILQQAGANRMDLEDTDTDYSSDEDSDCEDDFV